MRSIVIKNHPVHSSIITVIIIEYFVIAIGTSYIVPLTAAVVPMVPVVIGCERRGESARPRQSRE